MSINLLGKALVAYMSKYVLVKKKKTDCHWNYQNSYIAMKIRIFHKNFQILKSSDRKNKILFTNALFKLTKVEYTKLL